MFNKERGIADGISDLMLPTTIWYNIINSIKNSIKNIILRTSYKKLIFLYYCLDFKVSKPSSS